MNQLLKYKEYEEPKRFFMENYPDIFSSGSLSVRRNALESLFEDLIEIGEGMKKAIYGDFLSKAWKPLIESLEKSKPYNVLSGDKAITYMMDLLYVYEYPDSEEMILSPLGRIRLDQERMKDGKGVCLSKAEVQDIVQRIDNELHLSAVLPQDYFMTFAIVDAGSDELTNGLFGLRNHEAACILLNGATRELSEISLITQVARYMTDIYQKTMSPCIPGEIRSLYHWQQLPSKRELGNLLARILTIGIAEMIHMDSKVIELLYERESELDYDRKTREFYVRSTKLVMRHFGKDFDYEDTDKYYDRESTNIMSREIAIFAD